MIRGDGIGDVLQQHRFAGTRRSNDQSALTFSHRGQQVHDAGADVLFRALLLDALLRIKRRQIVEKDLVARFIGRFKVDRLDLYQREIFFAFVRRADVAADRVAGLEVELADLRWRDVNVVWAGKIVVIRGAEEAIAIRKDLEDAFSKDV